MIRVLSPGFLRWDEVDPARHPFDAASAVRVVRSLGPARPDACRAYDAARPLPLTARAARAYLDVCFFHPFDDGNARSPSSR